LADRAQLDLLKKSVASWNAWRKAQGNVPIDLRGADLKERDLSGAIMDGGDFREADLSGAYLRRARFVGARLEGANCTSANFDTADLTGAQAREARFVGADLFEACLAEASFDRAHFTGADLGGVNLRSAHFHKADLRAAEIRFADACRVDLTQADLRHASLINSDLSLADLTGAKIFGLTAWELKLERTVQRDLVITPPWEPEIVADDLDLASFLSMALRNGSIRRVLESASSRAVLILSQFVPAKVPILDVLRESLRRRGLFPVSFDVPNPGSAEIEARIAAVAPFVRFVLSDLPEGFDPAANSRAQIPRLDSPSVFVLRHAAAAETIPDLAPASGDRTDGVFAYKDVEHLRQSLETKILPRVLGNDTASPYESDERPAESGFRFFQGRRKASRTEET
jgi:uncharacterized protein YjbI with pentapeptide repeats